ncbi:glycoside hydrolase family 105 protein [Enterococcus casseliflavus]|uniref:glycoside hydrolase family 88/105 protein n=1 Tax=Enterococcus casseliflavus TaxID=37734 RepID=UPI0039A6405B
MYFKSEISAQKNYPSSNLEKISALVDGFIGRNPAIPYKPIFHSMEEYSYNRKGQVTVDLNQLFGEARVGTKTVTKTSIVAEYNRNMGISIACYGPTTCIVNGEIVYQSSPDSENLRRTIHFDCQLALGSNELLIVTEKTEMGFGFSIGASRPQWDPVHFFRPDCLNEIGMLHAEFHCNELEDFTDQFDKIEVENWRSPKKKFVLDAGIYLFATSEEDSEIVKGTFNELPSKMIEDENLLFYGPVSPTQSIPNRLIEVAEWEENTFWRRVSDGAYLRYFSNSGLYARCFYPMGVTLYGFLRAAKYCSMPHWEAYVRKCVDQVVSYNQYGLWDLSVFNYTGINTQYYWLDELDDCGSFGSLILESYSNGEVEKEKMANHIYEYMRTGQKRESDGVFSRNNDTMWIDDLYMSVPFLARFGTLFHQDEAFDDAAQQFKLFKKRMFIEDKNLMSHIYDLREQVANKIPWSRGNGWVLFSLTELLDRLPKSHPDFEWLVHFYNQMIEGILACVDTETGLWHQVLDESDSYLESSSTAMFICAMSRGIRNGYLAKPMVEQVGHVMEKAWVGLMTICVDKLGNLYGVCRGSGFSYSKTYYKQLGWLLNDSHGIGIVVLAGIELMQMQEFKDEQN